MTWEQLGPLVGVVVGAILGGGAQVLNTSLSSRRAERQNRQEAARLFIEAFYGAMTAKQLAALTKEGHFGDADPHKAYQEVLRTVGKGVMAMEARRSYLMLIDASEGAASLSDTLVEMVKFERGGTIGDPSAADDFRPVLSELVALCGRR